MFGIGTTELIIILLVALIVLGPKQLPGIARSLGKALGEFRRVTTDVQRTLNLEAAKIEEDEREKKKASAANKAADTSPPPETRPPSQAAEPVPPRESADPDPYATKQAEVSAKLPLQEPSAQSGQSAMDQPETLQPTRSTGDESPGKPSLGSPDDSVQEALTETPEASAAAPSKDQA